MIHENVWLHGVADLQPVNGGVRLQRVPESVRAEINPGAQMRVRQPDNCEIRFCHAGEAVDVTLSSEGETDVALFHGLFDGRKRWRVGREPVTLRVETGERLPSLDARWWQDHPIPPHVCRLVFGGRRREPVILHAVQGEGVRPPAADEQPTRRYLAYGTSITHGADCEGAHLSYVAQTAWHLQADLINLGVGGACHCDPAFADYIAARTDWDVASLALSVNMQRFPMSEFTERVRYMVNTVAGADTSRPVFCITLWPYFRDFGIDESEGCGGTPEAYRQALRDVVRDCPHPNVHLLEGPELLTNMAGLTADLIHPSDHAMIEMGRNLAARILPVLESRM